MSFYTLMILMIIIAVLANWADRYIMSSRMEPFRKGLANLWEKFKSPDAQELTQSLNAVFCDFFDLVYGSKMLSARRLVASAISSLLAFVVLFILGYLIFNEHMDSGIGAGHIALSFFVVAMLNLVPDYLSLAETRLVLNWSRDKGLLAVLFFIVVDLIATTIIFVIAGGICGFVIALMLALLAESSDIVSFILEWTGDAIDDDIGNADFVLISVVSIATTFFTSFFWICFVFSFLITRVAFKLFPLTKYLYDQLSETDKPITAIAGFCNIIITAIWLIFTAAFTFA